MKIRRRDLNKHIPIFVNETQQRGGSDVRATHQRGRGQSYVSYGGFELVHRGRRCDLHGPQRLDLDFEFLPVVLLSFRLVGGEEVGLLYGRWEHRVKENAQFPSYNRPVVIEHFPLLCDWVEVWDPGETNITVLVVTQPISPLKPAGMIINLLILLFLLYPD